MLQILIAVFGVIALAKGEMKVTATRVLRADRARIIGVGLLLLAATPFIPITLKNELLQMLGIPIGVIVLGIVAIAISDKVAPTGREKHPTEPEPSGGRQLVGETCVVCKDMVFTADQASPCRTCGDVVHDRCLKAHRAAAHGRKKTQPVAAATVV